MTIMIPVGGYIADALLEHNVFTTTTVRKILTCGGKHITIHYMLEIEIQRK